MIPTMVVHALNRMRDEYQKAYDGATRMAGLDYDPKTRDGLTTVRDEWREAFYAAESLVCNIPDVTYRNGDMSVDYRPQRDGGLVLVWGGRPKHVAFYFTYVQGNESVVMFRSVGIDDEREGSFHLNLYDGLSRLVELVDKVGGYETDVTVESLAAELGNK